MNRFLDRRDQQLPRLLLLTMLWPLRASGRGSPMQACHNVYYIATWKKFQYRLEEHCIVDIEAGTPQDAHICADLVTLTLAQPFHVEEISSFS